MVHIKDGKRYNTKTATVVLENESDCGKSDFRWFEETLYRTPKGGWFLDGEGHAMTKYSSSYDNLSGPGSGFFVLTNVEALSMLEDAGENDAIEKYFSDTIVDA